MARLDNGSRSQEEETGELVRVGNGDVKDIRDAVEWDTGGLN